MGLELHGFHWHKYNILIALWPVRSTSLEPTESTFVDRLDCVYGTDRIERNDQRAVVELSIVN